MRIDSFDSVSDGFRDAMNSGQLHASFSQLGEDGVLWWLFSSKHNGFYVDIGCHHPYRFSNTAVLHIFNGWRGINVDADARAIEAFQKVRPHDINLCCGVGSDSGLKEITIFEEGAINSFDVCVAQDPMWSHLKRETRTVEVRTLSDILSTYMPCDTPIDFLNIDVEGLDFAVLSSNDWLRFKPEVIAVEVHGFDLHAPSESMTFNYMIDLGYRLVSYVGVTCIFKRSK